MMDDANRIGAIIIRDATREDIPFLRKMLWEAIMASPTHVKHLGLAAIQQYEDEYWAKWAKQPEPTFIAQDETARPLGAISLRPEASEESGRGWRLAIGVEQEARGQGVGRRLIEHTFEFARADGAAYVSLLVDPENQRAIAVYKKTGFVESGTRDGVIAMRVTL